MRGPWAGPRPHYRRVRALLLRALGAVYLVAFLSLGVQVDGLISSRGIAPAGEFLEQARRVLGARAYTTFPTLLWLDASDAALHVLCWGGAAVSVMVIAGLLPGVGLTLLWLAYLSLTVVGQVFLGYQWDSLLLEAGLLALLLAPWGWWLGRAGEPSRVAIWLVRWLVFRLMFLSGVVKLASGDPTWRAWEAMKYHYETQPLPTWTSWFLHQLPAWFHSASVGAMFFAELVAPWLIFGPRPLRWVALGSTVGLQALIAATGNYGFFNILSAVLCLALLDDRDLGRPEEGPAVAPPRRPVRFAFDLLVGALIVLITTMEALDRTPLAVPPSAPLEALRERLAPLRSLNAYGLFAVMTTERPEIVVEGSRDGVSWTPYRFRWKPGDVGRRPRFTTPHMPRLDWQMWFAALAGDCRATPWFLRFERKLLEGSPEVLALLAGDPFGGEPPRLVRARLYRYRFTGRGARDWWTREEAGLFCPAIGLRDGELEVWPGLSGRTAHLPAASHWSSAALRRR